MFKTDDIGCCVQDLQPGTIPGVGNIKYVLYKLDELSPGPRGASCHNDL